MEHAEGTLNLDRIVTAAVALADAEGLERLSMRRLADALGAGAMSLYRHVPGKDALIAHMVESVFSELRYPDPPPGGWRTRIELAAGMEWQMYRRHGWVLTVIATKRPVLGPGVLTNIEWYLAAVDGLGLDPWTMVQIFLLVSDYVQGAALFDVGETTERRRSGTSIDQWWSARVPQMRQLLESGRYPVLARLYLSPEAGDTYDKDFEFGLRRLLDGLEAFLGR